MAELTVTTPAGVEGPADVVVTNPDGQSGTLGGGFTYLALPPNPTSVTPGSGPVAGGTNVTIAGTDIDPAATVTIGGVNAPVDVSPP